MRDDDAVSSAASIIPETVVPAPPTRVLSVDVQRGLTIAFMILVNDPGDGRHTFTQLEHSDWNGCTLTDLVFPNFLFLVGVSLIFSLAARIARTPGGTLDGPTRRNLAFHIVRRAAIIFALDLALAAFPYFHLTQLRLYGVLTRIALCYLAAGLLCLVTRRMRTLLLVAGALLVAYWALLRLVPVPGFGVPTHQIPLLDMDRNLAAWMDRGLNAFLQRTIHTGVLYEKTRDPEGLLSTLPSIATTLLGAAAGLWMRSAHAPAVKRNRLALAGLGAMLAGLAWNPWFPINKNLWTSSYVLFAGGFSLLMLALFTWLVDMHPHPHHVPTRPPVVRAALWPWLVFGSNAVVAYATSALLVKSFFALKLPTVSGTPTSVWTWVYWHVFARGGHSTDWTSLAFALCFVVLCFLPNWLLWRRRIFIKI